ncbi:uncharacterized protein LOC128395076 [Panonychus citri]|uniref:uncharacterized protein LOC128395076 n=1 Tax=Panonychus citri TaxID=50023 RepID=UPI0023072EF1|nr:uncharacterized protein LOC128395076 [Panonychus citri]
MLIKLKNRLTNYIESNVISEGYLISLVERLESSGHTFNSCNRGYKQSTKLSTYQHTWHVINHLWYFVVCTRSIILMNSDNPLDSLYLGDFFSSTPGKNFLHANLIVYYLLFFSSRAAVHIKESSRPMLMFQFFDQIKYKGFDSANQLLSSTNYFTWRIYLYIALKFYFIGIPTVALSLFILCLVFALENPSLYLSVYHFLWYFFWLLLITGPLCFNVFVLFWYYTHTMCLVPYLFLAFSDINETGTMLNGLSDPRELADQLKTIRTYLKRQNRLLNLLKIYNVDISTTMWTGYLISCFLADFSLFMGLFVDSGSFTMNVISLSLAITAFSNLFLLHFSGLLVNNKIMSIQENNFNLQARGVNIFPKSISIWINSTQERIENGEIGVTICHIFAATQSSLLYSILENSGIFMMFVANFKKS